MSSLNLAIADLIEPATATRPLTPDDLEKLGEVRGVQKSIPLTRRLSHRHHELARTIAKGASDFEAAAATGYERSYISILKSDPAFRELVNFYRTKQEEEFVDTSKKLAIATNTAIDILQDRLEEEPETFSHGQILEIAKFGADRTGHGPSSTSNVKVQVDMSARLRLARERSAKADAERLIDATDVVDITPEAVDER